MMYSELETIERVVDIPTRIYLLALFIEEYGGWCQHLKSVGSGWGAGGEESMARKELAKAKAHIARLRDALIRCTDVQPSV